MSDLLDALDSMAEGDLVNVVIDTPSGSASKFKYDKEARCYRLSRLLPRGAVFPYNFGSVPRTAAEDGDALDVLVLAQAPFFVGCLVAVKLIGILTAEQTEGGKTIRNDRLLGAPVTNVNRPLFEHLDDLGAARIGEIEHFFVSYNQAHGRAFKPLGRGGPDDAMQALRKAQDRYANPR